MSQNKVKDCWEDESSDDESIEKESIEKESIEKESIEKEIMEAKSSKIINTPASSSIEEPFKMSKRSKLDNLRKNAFEDNFVISILTYADAVWDTQYSRFLQNSYEAIRKSPQMKKLLAREMEKTGYSGEGKGEGSDDGKHYRRQRHERNETKKVEIEIFDRIIKDRKISIDTSKMYNSFNEFIGRIELLKSLGLYDEVYTYHLKLEEERKKLKESIGKTQKEKIKKSPVVIINKGNDDWDKEE